MAADLDPIFKALDHERIHRAGSAWTDRGTAFLLSGLPKDREESVRCHLRAIRLLEQLPHGTSAEFLADLGTAWVNLGCAFLADNTPGSLEQAREAFSRAIGLLENLPLSGCPRFRHNLAAAWMNRADASARMRSGEALLEYHEAIKIARELPLDERASFRVLLASSWINLGNLHLSLETFSDAGFAFDRAIESLGPLPGAGHRLACHHAATAWANRGEALLRVEGKESAAEAVQSAKQALSLLEGRDLGGSPDAKLSLRALRVRASGLESLLKGRTAGADRVGELTDVAERGIATALAHRFSAPDVFDPFVVWFFSFGSRAYGRYQPQFLAEYIDEILRRAGSCENPGLAADLRRVGRQATASALKELGRVRLLVQGARPTELLMGAVQGLRDTELRLSA